MSLHKSTVKVFLLGSFSGCLICCLIFVGIGLIGAMLDWDQMTTGICGDLYVDINENPGKGYDWSLDIIRQGKMWAQFGKRSSSDSVDRCRIFGPNGDISFFIVFADEEVGPGAVLFNDNIPITSFSFNEKKLEYMLTYGPYGMSAKNIKAGNVGYVDIDFDGQFDAKEVFNENGGIDTFFIWCEDEWQEVKAREGVKAILDGGDSAYTFCHGDGWIRSN